MMDRCFCWRMALEGLTISIFMFAGVLSNANADSRVAFKKAVSLGLKYDSNLNLLRKNKIDSAADDLITEMRVHLSVNRDIGEKTWLETQFSGLANWHRENRDKNWYFGKLRAAMGYSLGKNRLGLSNEFQDFLVPKQDSVGFYRNTSILTYKRSLYNGLQLHLGYENIANFYPENAHFNYTVNGAFAEVRQPWNLNFSTVYAYDFQYYRGSYNAQISDPAGSPESGTRHTFKIGFDWMQNRNVFNGYYLFQIDRSSGEGLNQIGEFEGNEESLDVDSEFNYVKHKATLLYSRKLTSKLTLSSYEELIFRKNTAAKNPINDPQLPNQTLFLSATYLNYKIANDWILKTRYLFRAKQSVSDIEDYSNHIFFAGMELRF